LAKPYTSFGYDDRGNVTSNSHNTFYYNRANQMVASGSNQYVYDGYNRRVMSVEAGKTSYSFYSQSGQLLYSESSDGGINYIFLGKKLIAKDGFIPQNGGKQHYLPFGSSIEGEINDVGYTGHKYDKSLNLTYMQARYYDPVLGRFMSPDPIGSADQFNLYAYVGNDPVNAIDPTGKILVALGRFLLSKIGKQAVKQEIKKEGKEEIRDELKDAAKKVEVSKSKHPESAKHIQDAQKSGQPKTLTIDRAGAKDRRREAMQGKEKEAGKDRDEYPPAMFKEGGKDSSVRNIDPSDNRGAGTCIGNQCRALQDGTKVDIEVVD
jgi:RHS repeat-associated protein